MIFVNDKISIRQLQILLILNIFGTGVLTLPRRATLYANQDGWISVLIAVLCAALLSLIVTTIANKFPSDSFYKYCGDLLSRPVAFVLAMGFVFKLIINLALELRFFGEVVRQTLLETTPFWAIALLILAIGGYAASKGYETRARLGEMLFLLVFLPIIFVFVVASFKTDVQNVMPVLQTPVDGLLRGAFYSGMSFRGIELCLLAFPFLSSPNNARKGVFFAVLAIGILMAIVAFLTIAAFGPADTEIQLFPMLQMMDHVEVPGSLLERQKAFIMSFWIISAFFIVNAYLFFSSLLMKSTFKKGTHSNYILLCAAAVFAVSLFVKTLSDAERYMELMFVTFDLFYLAALPILLLTVSSFKKLLNGGNRGSKNG
ncbi:MAG: spore germination protein [Defluviitaleaceae bacterium]|nr:spore germination protein [Defluviitaleaceae bacterium]